MKAKKPMTATEKKLRAEILSLEHHIHDRDGQIRVLKNDLSRLNSRADDWAHNERRLLTKVDSAVEELTTLHQMLDALGCAMAPSHPTSVAARLSVLLLQDKFPAASKVGSSDRGVWQ